MSLFELREWWHYRRAAKGRHGAHSPFVYRFIEEALRPSGKRFMNNMRHTSEEGILWEPSPLLARIAGYFAIKKVVQITAKGRSIYTASQEEATDLILLEITALPPAKWIQIFALVEANDRCVVAVHNIHRTTEHAAGWKALSRQPTVTLSIDLFQAGLLFFSKDFKAKQHFVLKYPA